MKEIIQLYTEAFASNFINSRRIIFLAEGYRTSDESIFYQDVYKIVDQIENSFPFSVLKGSGNSKMFSLFLSFTASSEFSFASSQQQAVGRTVFESYFENGKLYLNHSKINEYIDELIYKSDTNALPTWLKDTLSKGLNEKLVGFSLSQSNTLLVILLPEASRTDIEIEVNNPDTYYAIGTSCDKLSEQIILKGIGKMLGFGDEYDLPGTDYLAPHDFQGDAINLFFPNLFYAPNITVGPNPTTDEDFIWRWIFDQNYNTPVPLHKNTMPTTPNRVLPVNHFSYTEVELWEGGGGFRTNVYRSAEDCIMRRKIGDTTLPLKDHKVAFCPVCRELLDNLFTLK